MSETPEYQLKIEDIHLSFGGLKALSGVTTGVKKGEIFSIIGPNGAGKTCLLNCINSFYQPQKGGIIFEGTDITRLKAHRIAALGIARTFQNVELFAHMTVLDNIKLGGHVHLKSGVLSGGIYFGQARKEEMAFRKHIEEKIVDLLEIEHIRKQPVHTLPYGLQKRVELARALAMRPKIGSIRNSQQVKRPKSLIVFLFIIFSRACCEAKGEALRHSMHGSENVRNCILKH